MSLKQLCFFKCGFDSSSDHSMYNINIKEDIEEGNMTVVFICSIKLFVEFDGTILWFNNVSNSPKYCRPLKLLHKCETKENLNPFMMI